MMILSARHRQHLPLLSFSSFFFVLFSLVFICVIHPRRLPFAASFSRSRLLVPAFSALLLLLLIPRFPFATHFSRVSFNVVSRSFPTCSFYNFPYPLFCKIFYFFFNIFIPLFSLCLIIIASSRSPSLPHITCLSFQCF